MSLVNYDSFALLNAVLTEIEEAGSSKRSFATLTAIFCVY
jgi:hypothetical protein